MIDPLYRELLNAYGFDANYEWEVLSDLTMRLSIGLRRHGGYDAGDFAGLVKTIAKTPRGCIKAALRKYEQEPWIKNSIYGPRF